MGKRKRNTEKQELQEKDWKYKILNRSDLEIDLKEIIDNNLDIAIRIHQLNGLSIDSINLNFKLTLKSKIREEIKTEDRRDIIIATFLNKSLRDIYCRKVFLNLYEEVNNNSIFDKDGNLLITSNNPNIAILEEAEKIKRKYLEENLDKTDLWENNQNEFEVKNSLIKEMEREVNMSKKARKSKNNNKKENRVIPLKNKETKKEITEFIKMDKETIENCLEDNIETIELTDELIEEVCEEIKESCKNVKEIINNEEVKGEYEMKEFIEEVTEEINDVQEEVKSNVRDIKEVFTEEEIKEISDDLFKDLIIKDEEEKKNEKHTKSLFGLISHGIKSTAIFIKDRVLDVVQYVENKFTSCFKKIKNLFSKKEKTSC